MVDSSSGFSPSGLVDAKIQEGLDALDAGDAVDGEEFFARWKARLTEKAGSPSPGRVQWRR